MLVIPLPLFSYLENCFFTVFYVLFLFNFINNIVIIKYCSRFLSLYLTDVNADVSVAVNNDVTISDYNIQLI